MKILIIDDNKDFADALLRLLGAIGYPDVRAAYSGPDGIREAITMNPEYLLIDLQMPGMDGFSVIRMLRKSINPSSKYIAITGYGQDSDRRATQEAKFDFHLTKPFSIADLKQILGDQRKPSIG